MKKDIIVRGIRASRFIWREAKKPVLRIKNAGRMTILPSKECEESGQPRFTFNLELELTLVYILLGILMLNGICRSIRLFFKR